MHKSADHILITHTGSLPRGAELNDLLIADEAGEKVDKSKLNRKDRAARRLCDGEAALGRVSTSPMTASKAGSAFKPTCLSACPDSAASSKRPFGREWVELPLFTQKFHGTVAENRQSIRLPGMRRRAQIYRQGSHQNRARSLQAPGGGGASRRFPKCSSPSRRRGSSRRRCSMRTIRPTRRISTPSPARCITNTNPWSMPDCPADRRAGSGDGARAPVPGQVRHGIRQDHRAAHRSAEQGAARNSA